MVAVQTTISLIQFRGFARQSLNAGPRDFAYPTIVRCDSLCWRRSCPRLRRVSWGRASLGSVDAGDGKDGAAERSWVVVERVVGRLQAAIGLLPPAITMTKRKMGSNFAICLYIAIAFLVVCVKQILFRNPHHSQHGSVADLVKRGQLRSDRRGIFEFNFEPIWWFNQWCNHSSQPLKYEDPFNNPLVKVGKSNSTVEMCGKTYRLAPVTLTEEEQSSHQKRRSRAYKWKRPTIFLKEGDSIPPDSDPDTVRWIPANHPFATTVSEIDEDLAQNNVYQKNGIPFRIREEHEALQRKLESLQSQEQKMDKLVTESNSIHELEAKPQEQPEPSPSLGLQHGQVEKLKGDQGHGSFADNA